MANKGEIALGDEVTDKYTGVSGTVMGITDWLNGCQRITVQPRGVHDGKPIELWTTDVQDFEVTKVGTRDAVPSGGPRPSPTRAPDPR